MKERPQTKKILPYRYKPGQSGNPGGRPKLSLADYELRHLTIETYRKVIEMAMMGKRRELRELVKDPNTPAIQAGVAKSLLNAIERGESEVLERFAARIVGKIPDVVVHEHLVRVQHELKTTEEALKLTDGELRKRLERIHRDV